MKYLLFIFVILILADRNVHPINVTSDYASAKYLQSEITAEVIMFESIPGYPNYQFNMETLEVKSLERKIKMWHGGYRTHYERILIPHNYMGYYQIALHNEEGGKTLRRHQISWIVKYGELPPKPLQIDHIDANKINDHWSNLQILTNRQNCSKHHQQRGTKYPRGVSWLKDNKKYMAKIYKNNKQVYIGSFDTISEASTAYQNALRNLE